MHKICELNIKHRLKELRIVFFFRVFFPLLFVLPGSSSSIYSEIDVGLNVIDTN